MEIRSRFGILSFLLLCFISFAIGSAALSIFINMRESGASTRNREKLRNQKKLLMLLWQFGIRNGIPFSCRQYIFFSTHFVVVVDVVLFWFDTKYIYIFCVHSDDLNTREQRRQPEKKSKNFFSFTRCVDQFQ